MSNQTAHAISFILTAFVLIPVGIVFITLALPILGMAAICSVSGL